MWKISKNIVKSVRMGLNKNIYIHTVYGYAFDIQISTEDVMELFVCVEMNEVYSVHIHITPYI